MKSAPCLIMLLLAITIANSKGEPKSKNPVVELDSGKLEGLVLSSRERQRKFNAFLSIPYAEPPIGSLRFMPPKPKVPWDGVFAANRKDIRCPQFGYLRKNDTEDCLVLNVYSPLRHGCITNSLLPVMVILHEGGFVVGSGTYDFYRPEKLMDHDVVFVSPNYRLGVLGFLNTQDKQSPGNYGMLDQVMVLRWVKDNIRKFCGDPNKVTIFGNSAGGSSVVYHMLSPLSKGLFHAAIAQSGSALKPGSSQTNPLKWAKKVGRLANCTDVNSTIRLVECLRTKTIDELFRTRKAEVKYYILNNVGPSLECAEGQGFLKEHSLELMQSGKINKVPFITGVVKDEGRFLLDDILDFKKYNGQKFLDEEFCGFLSYVIDEDENNMKEICTAVKKLYFDGKNISDQDVLKSCLTKSLGDMRLCAGTAKTAELFSTAGIPTQAYKFTYSIEGDNVPGNFTNHGDEIILMLDRKWSNRSVINNTKNDTIMANFFQYVWTQFSMNRNHTVNLNPPGMASIRWPLYKSEGDASRNYLEINLNPQLRKGLLCENMDFWIKTLVSLDKI